jgi:hypothetical protein
MGIAVIYETLDALRPVAIAATPIALWLIWRRRDRFFGWSPRREDDVSDEIETDVSIDEKIKARARSDADWAMREFAACARRAAESLFHHGGRDLLPLLLTSVASQLRGSCCLDAKFEVPPEVVAVFETNCKAKVLRHLQQIDR